MRAGLVLKMEDWKFSSFMEHINVSNESLCNKILAFQLLDLLPETFYHDSYLMAGNDDLKNIF